MRTLIRRKEAETCFEHAMGIQIGETNCTLKCRDTAIFEKLQTLYRNFLTDEPADIAVELEFTDNLNIDELTAILSRSRYINQGNHFRSSGKLLKGSYDLESRTIKITIEKQLIDPDSKINLLNQLISMSYYSACKMKYDTNPPAMLVHACGILRDGWAMVFTGPSDIGKTTIARLCGDRHGEIFSDEMVLISQPGSNGNGISVQNAPIQGELDPGRNFNAPLSCICLLKQNSRMTYKYLDKAEAYLRFIRQIIAPTCVGDYDKRTAYSLMADFSSEIVKAVPIYELEFNRDGNALWKIADELNGLSGRELHN